MNVITLEYWNALANQLIVICSLLSGFSIAVTANLLVYNSKNKVAIVILKAATIAAGCFLVTVFAMTQISMMTTAGYPGTIDNSDIFLPKTIGVFTFLTGILSLSTVIALSGWTKSKSTGIFTTIVGILTLLLILSTLVHVN